jgi:hypothetical protein
MAENENYETIFGKTLPSRISETSMKRFMGYEETPFIILCKTGYIMINMAENWNLPTVFIESLHMEFEEYFSVDICPDTRSQRDAQSSLPRKAFFFTL